VDRQDWLDPSGSFVLSELADPVRRRLYEYVAGQDHPVRRDEAAEAAGISRTLAAYHLDRLADAGLLAASYARPPGQTGPGSGRPAKHYRRVTDEVSVTVPPRTYGLLAGLLADAVAADGSGSIRSALMTAAEDEGHRVGQEGGDLIDTLRRRGYEPALTADGELDLRNCPFHHLAQRHVELVCGLNHALLRGLLAGGGQNPDLAELAPRPGRCCVAIHAASRDEPARRHAAGKIPTSGKEDGP
jgi:predicted ArsR family transcriptional regulator